MFKYALTLEITFLTITSVAAIITGSSWLFGEWLLPNISGLFTSLGTLFTACSATLAVACLPTLPATAAIDWLVVKK